jgi:predicted ABC-type ATPase
MAGSFIGRRQTHVYQNLQRSVRRLLMRVHSKSVKRMNTPEIEAVEILRRYQRLIRKVSLTISRSERRRILQKSGLFPALYRLYRVSPPCLVRR